MIAATDAASNIGRSRSFFASDSLTEPGFDASFAAADAPTNTGRDHARILSPNRQPRWTLTLDRRGRCCFKHRPFSLALCLCSDFYRQSKITQVTHPGRACTSPPTDRLPTSADLARAFSSSCQPRWTSTRASLTDDLSTSANVSASPDVPRFGCKRPRGP